MNGGKLTGLLARPEVFARTPEERLAALERANEIRVARARLKRAIGAGGIDAIATLRQPPDFAAGMRVRDLLQAIPTVGEVKAKRLMNRAAVAYSKTLGGLTGRQRGALVALLEART